MKQFFARLLVVCVILLTVSLASADDFADYNEPAGQQHDITLPTITAGWSVAIDSFPAATTTTIGNYEAKGRVIAANDHTIYMQNTYGSSTFIPVATTSVTMDPSFVKVSPDGSKIALGVGYGKDLLVFPTSVLNPSSPPVLNGHASVTEYSVNYNDAAWLDNQYLLVNGGSWPGPGTGSDLGALDTNDPSDTGVPVIENVPGSSGGVAVDNNGNVISGVGYAPSPINRTGEIKLWTNSDILAAIGGSALDYELSGNLIADNILSAATLGVDAENNLHVGGGDAFGGGGASELGYAAIVDASVLQNAADNTGSGYPVNEGDVNEYKTLEPDPCGDDSATTVAYGNWGKGLAVMWNPDEGSGCGSPGTDYWMAGVTPVLSVFYPGSAPDTDTDGIPDGADNAYLTMNAGQIDSDGDGYGNSADADYNNDGVVDFTDLSVFSVKWGLSLGSPGYDPQVDSNGDDTINFNDLSSFSVKWGTTEPWY